MSRARLVLLLLGTGAALLGTAALVWVEATAPTATAPVRIALTGAQAAPALPAAGLVLVAGALALAVAGRVVARLSAVVLAAVCLGALGQVVALVADPAAAAAAGAAAATGVGRLEGEPGVGMAAWAAIALLLLAAAGAVAAFLAAGRWPARRTRYDRPGTAAAGDARTRALDDWDALGRGEDPTDKGIG